MARPSHDQSSGSAGPEGSGPAPAKLVNDMMIDTPRFPAYGETATLPSPAIARRPTAPAWPAQQPNFAALLARFEPIALVEMSEVALQDRTDTKFVMREGQLYNALATLTQQYRVLDIRGVRLNQYLSLIHI